MNKPKISKQVLKELRGKLLADDNNLNTMRQPPGTHSQLNSRHQLASAGNNSDLPKQNQAETMEEELGI